MFEFPREGMGLLRCFPELTDDLIGLLWFRGEEANRHLEIVVAHAYGTARVSWGDGELSTESESEKGSTSHENEWIDELSEYVCDYAHVVIK